MTNYNANVGCQLVGEYVDEAELPANVPVHSGEVVHAQIAANCLDFWARDNGFKEFTVLLKDGRVVAVRGHGLKLMPSTADGESGSYGILLRTEDEEVLIALFKIIEVVGIFHGEMRSDSKIAG
jgi:hypothetical protein